MSSVDDDAGDTALASSALAGNRVLTLKKRTTATTGRNVKFAQPDSASAASPVISAEVAALTRKRRRSKAAVAAGATGDPKAATTIGNSDKSTVATVNVAQFHDSGTSGERYDAFGATKEDDDIIAQINDASEQHKQANEHKWYNSYGSVPTVESLPAAIGARERLDWRSNDLQIEEHWFVPQSMADVAGNESSINNIVARWIEVWTREPLVLPQRCIMMLRGAPGIGKTTAIKLLLHRYGFNNIVEINASDVRSRKLINERLVPILMSSTCAAQRRTAVVLEEVDGLYSGGSSGGGGSLQLTSNAPTSSLASVAGGVASGSDSLVRFFAGKGFKPRNAIGGLVARCDRCVRGPCEQCTTMLANYRKQACKSKCAEKKKCCAACKKQAEARQRACAECAKLPCNVCRDAPPPVTVDYETFKPFRSPVPIIMLANTEFAPFLKSLEELSLFVPFKPVPLGAVQTRLKHLCYKFNIEWSEPALLDALATRCTGDLRKGVALLVGAVRAAYARKRLLVPARPDLIGKTTDVKEREAPALHIRSCDCEAFLGKSSADLRDANYTIWSALTYTMRECTSLVAVQTLCAENEFRMLSDWIFENYLHCAALPENVLDAQHRATALANMRLLSRAFSEAETVRSDTAYLSDRLALSIYTHLGVVLPTMLIRLPKYFGQPDRALAAHISRPPGLSSSSYRSDAASSLQFQKSSLGGENGNAGGTHSRAIKERNYYASTHGLLCQADTDMFFDFNNYISKLTATRSQSAMAFKEENQLVPDHRAVPKAIKTKMSKAEQETLRSALKAREHVQTVINTAEGAETSTGKTTTTTTISARTEKSLHRKGAQAVSNDSNDDESMALIVQQIAKRAKTARQTTLTSWTNSAALATASVDEPTLQEDDLTGREEYGDNDCDDNGCNDNDCDDSMKLNEPPVRLATRRR
jgi:DNA polymerase III delta prime subunit